MFLSHASDATNNRIEALIIIINDIVIKMVFSLLVALIITLWRSMVQQDMLCSFLPFFASRWSPGAWQKNGWVMTLLHVNDLRSPAPSWKNKVIYILCIISEGKMGNEGVKIIASLFQQRKTSEQASSWRKKTMRNASMFVCPSCLHFLKDLVSSPIGRRSWWPWSHRIYYHIYSVEMEAQE